MSRVLVICYCCGFVLPSLNSDPLIADRKHNIKKQAPQRAKVVDEWSRAVQPEKNICTNTFPVIHTQLVLT